MADLTKKIPVQIGPYQPHESADITERLMNSGSFYQFIEQVFRGEVSNDDILYRLSIFGENAHSWAREEQEEDAHATNPGAA